MTLKTNKNTDTTEERKVLAYKSKGAILNVLIPVALLLISSIVIGIFMKNLWMTLMLSVVCMIFLIQLLLVIVYPKIIITYDCDGLYINTLFLRNRFIPYEEILEVIGTGEHNTVSIRTPRKSYKVNYLFNAREMKDMINELIDKYTVLIDDGT